ncbi:MAG TPA: AbrB/MazE/SpoVT family DNA-binding domain-containing protein [Candidatus Nanoarchaeia archaeon]|nr:AbrB/MazE/SpoVT family DNA-binding domain-containing protein [Candidatus Nanoarchaeia archaeon]
MHTFKATPKKWGNSLGITIPKEIVKEEGLSTKKAIEISVAGPRSNKLKELFGTLKFKKSTQQIMDEIDEGYD